MAFSFFGSSCCTGGVVLHELGHYLLHAALGYEINHFAYAGVISGDPPGGVDPEFASSLSFAAGAVVLKDVPEQTTVVGVPAEPKGRANKVHKII